MDFYEKGETGFFSAITKDNLVKIFDLIPDQIIILDVNHKIMAANRGFCELVGLPKEEVVGKYCYEIVHNTRTPISKCPCVNFIRNNRVTPIEFYEERLNKWLFISIAPLFDDKNDLIGIVHVSRDISKQKHIESISKDKEERLRTLINAMPDLVCFKDGEGRWLEINDAGRHLFRLQGVDFIGKKDSEIAQLNPFFKTVFLTCEITDEKAWAQKTIYHQEEIIPQPNGEDLVYDVIKVPLFYPDGKRKGLVVLGRDITERKKAEIAIKETAERYRTLFEKFQDAIFIMDGEIFIDCNPAAERLFNCSKEDIIGSTPFKFSPLLQEDGTYSKDKALLYVKRALKGYPQRFEWIHTRYDGQPFYAEVNINRIYINQKSHLLVFTRDITEQKKIRESLQKSEERYKSLVENTMDGYFVIDRESYKFLFLNQRICSIFGYTMDEALKLTLWEVIAEEEQERLRKEFDLLKTTNKLRSNQIVYKVKRKDGTTFLAELSVSLVTFDERPVLQGTLRDVTEREQFLKHLHQVQKMEALGTLTAGLAHEFNNILAAILGGAQLAAFELGENAKPIKYLRHIEDSARRGATVVQHMLAFASPLVETQATTDVNQSIERVKEILKPSLSPQIKIDCFYSEDVPKVLISPDKLEQTILNIALNANEAMPQGGEIRFSTKVVKADRDFCRINPWAEEGIYVLIEISDTGEGIAKDIIEKIYEPFFTTKATYGGVGLGLSVAYSIIKSHGGHITTESIVGKGTTFRIYLPSYHEELIPEIEAIEPGKDAEKQKRVLLVDDEQLFCDITSQFLSAKGYNVTVANDGRVALSLYKESLENNAKYHIVILDLAMPDMDGIECLKELYKIDQEVKVLIITGYRPDQVDLEGEGVNDLPILWKPFEFKDLYREINKILNE